MWPDIGAVTTAAVLSGVVLLGVVALGGWMLYELLRQHGRILIRLDALEMRLANPVAAQPSSASARAARGLPAGSWVPLPPGEGDAVSDSATPPESRARSLLLFTSATCGPCADLMPQIRDWQRALAGVVEIHLVEHTAQIGVTYGARGTPSALAVDPDGLTEAPLAEGAAEIRALVERVIIPAAQLAAGPAR